MEYSEAFIFLFPYSSPPPAATPHFFSPITLVGVCVQYSACILYQDGLYRAGCHSRILQASIVKGTRLESRPYYRVFAGHSTQPNEENVLFHWRFLYFSYSYFIPCPP
jgi:hypothetical protein